MHLCVPSEGTFDWNRVFLLQPDRFPFLSPSPQKHLSGHSGGITAAAEEASRGVQGIGTRADLPQVIGGGTLGGHRHCNTLTF